MNLKRFFSFLSPRHDPIPPIRIDGSLSGKAFHDEEILERLQEVVKALSLRRPYRYDLAFEGGRFSLVLVDPVLPLEAMTPSPEAALSQDLQSVLDALPPEERCKVQCTFRALWNEGGEVKGLALLVEPPGRVKAKLKARPEEAYDRLAEEQAAEGIYLPATSRLPPWIAWLAGIAVLILGFLGYYLYGPMGHMAAMVEVVEQGELRGLGRLMSIAGCELDGLNLEIALAPREDYESVMGTILQPEQGSSQDLSTDREIHLERLAAEAILKGSLELKLFDDEDVLIDKVHLDLTGFEGIETFKIRTREIQLTTRPARATIGP